MSFCTFWNFSPQSFVWVIVTVQTQRGSSSISYMGNYRAVQTSTGTRIITLCEVPQMFGIDFGWYSFYREIFPFRCFKRNLPLFTGTAVRDVQISSVSSVNTQRCIDSKSGIDFTQKSL